MSVPSSVWVMGQLWSIEPMPSEYSEICDDVGACIPDKRRLYYRLGQPLSSLQDTIVHEVLHAAWHLLDLSDDDDEEEIVRPLSSLIAGMLIDPRNRVFWEYLSDE